MLLQAEFLAIALVLVYVGAVMVLFLFVVMMLDIKVDPLREGFWKRFPWPVGDLIALEMAAEMIALRVQPCSQAVDPLDPARAAGGSNTELAGRRDVHRLPAAVRTRGVLLLVAIIAAIALTLRVARHQAPGPVAQVMVRARTACAWSRWPPNPRRAAR
jgi:NADH-quinone oxidoreductase subunit J